MAAPHISGVVALIVSKHKAAGGNTPAQTPEQMIEHLHRTCIDLGETGPDIAYGYGLVNPADLLKLGSDTAPSKQQSWWMDFILFALSELAEKLKRGESILPKDIEQLKSRYRKQP
jgi:hypothetical protein